MLMKKKLLMILISICSLPLSAQSNNDTAVVLELFTSQGCSSCPPADELLDEIREEYQDQNVFVLSYHVDYWNRLGWRDPFSTEEFSDYQRDYGSQFRSRSIYTPQLVVNGSEHFTGSNRYKASDALKKYTKAKTTNSINVNNLKQNGNSLSFDYQVNGPDFNTITLALVVSERTTNIARGENRNRKLKNTNIVATRTVKRDTNGMVAITIPNWVNKNDKLSIIGYTQDTSLRTTGATKVDI